MISPATDVTRQRIMQRDGRVCQYCGTTEAFTYVVEHILARQRGGTNRDCNLVVACQRCNSIKKDKVWLPRNFAIITEDDPRWAAKLQALAVPIRFPAPQRSSTFHVYADVQEQFDTAVDKMKRAKGQVIGALMDMVNRGEISPDAIKDKIRAMHYERED